MEAYYLTPIKASARGYCLVPVKSKRSVYYLAPIGGTKQEIWKYYRTFGFSTNDMLDNKTHTWSDIPGDYKDSMASLTFPDNAVAVKIEAISGAQCFNKTTSQWTVRIKFKTQQEVGSLDSFIKFGEQVTKVAAEEDYLKLSPITLKLGTDKKLHWGFTDYPITDNTDDKAFFKIYYREKE